MTAKQPRGIASHCCQAPVRVKGSKEKAAYFVCTMCLNACAQFVSTAKPPKSRELDYSVPQIQKEGLTDYAKGYSTGRVHLLQGLTERLREDSDLRTVVSVAELLNNMLEDEVKLREEIYYGKK